MFEEDLVENIYSSIYFYFTHAYDDASKCNAIRRTMEWYCYMGFKYSVSGGGIFSCCGTPGTCKTQKEESIVIR
jgi:hypothetical protein